MMNPMWWDWRLCQGCTMLRDVKKRAVSASDDWQVHQFALVPVLQEQELLVHTCQVQNLGVA